MGYWGIPIVGALIGYITNKIAICMLFHPYKNILGFQGVIPRNKEKICKNLGLLTENFLSTRDICAKLQQENFAELLAEEIWDRLGWWKHLIFDMQEIISDMIYEFLDNAEEIDSFLKESSLISTAISNQINKLDLREIEKLIRHTSSAEIRAIELWGCVIGFIIGVIQCLLILKIG